MILYYPNPADILGVTVLSPRLSREQGHQIPSLGFSPRFGAAWEQRTLRLKDPISPGAEKSIKVTAHFLGKEIER